MYNILLYTITYILYYYVHGRHLGGSRPCRGLRLHLRVLFGEREQEVRGGSLEPGAGCRHGSFS